MGLCRRAAPLAAVLALFAAAALLGESTFADGAGIPFAAGNTLGSAIDPDGEEDAWRFDAMEGGFLSVSIARTKDSALQPEVRLVAPDGTDVPIGGFLSASEKKVALKNVPLPATGSYLLVVSGAAGTSGGYSVKTRIKPPKLAPRPGLVLTGYALADVVFPAAGGGLASITLSWSEGAGSLRVLDLLDPDGATMAGDWPGALVEGASQIKGKVPIAGRLGDYRLRLRNVTASTVTYDVALKVKFPKAAKLTVTADPVEPRPALIDPDEDAAGNEVTITGSGFADGSTVWFGDLEVATTFVSEGEVKAIVPDGHGALVAAVRNPDGQENGLPFTITGDPEVRVLFPPATSLTDADEIHVSGTARFVTSLTVGGIAATFDADGKTWEALVPLSYGPNVLEVDVIDLDSALHTGVAVVAVENTDRMFEALDDVAVDLAGNRAYVADEFGNAIWGVVLTTGRRGILSSDTAGTGPVNFRPSHIALDKANGRLLVSSNQTFGILAMDLTTGNRTVISDASTGSGPALILPRGIVLDAANDRALVVDFSLDAVIAVDLATGDRTVISDAVTGSGTALTSPEGAALDVAGNRLLVTDTTADSLFAVDLTTGDRTVLSGIGTGTGTGFSAPDDVDLDTVTRVAYVTDSIGDRVFAVDLATGNRTILSDGTRGTGPFPHEPTSVVADSGNNRLLVACDDLDALLVVDTLTGNRTVVSGAFTGDGEVFKYPRNFCLDPDEGRILVSDGHRLQIFAVDLATGDRSALSGGGVGTGDALSLPGPILRDPANLRLLVAGGDSIRAVDPVTGNRTVLSSDAIGSGDGFGSLAGMAFGIPPGTVVVSDSVEDTIWEVDLATGDRDVLADSAHGIGPRFGAIRDLRLDPDSGFALFVDELDHRLLALDRATGDRTVISDGERGAGDRFMSPTGTCADGSGTAALVSSAGTDGLFRVDLASGDRTVVSNADLGLGCTIRSPGSVDVLHPGHAALLTDLEYSALLVVHLRSGDRVFLSR